MLNLRYKNKYRKLILQKSVHYLVKETIRAALMEPVLIISQVMELLSVNVHMGIRERIANMVIYLTPAGANNLLTERVHNAL